MRQPFQYSKHQQRIYHLKSILYAAQVLLLLLIYKIKKPYLRLGQIIEIILTDHRLNTGRHHDLFVTEDKDLLEVIKKHQKQKKLWDT